MNRFPLPHGFAVTDVLDLSGRPDDGAAAVTITWESEPGKTELELTLDLPGRAASLVVMSAAGVLFPPVRIPFPRAEDRVAIRFEVDHGLVVISSGEAELKRLRLSSWPGSVRHVLVSGLTDITLAHRNNPINALNWRGAALPSGLPSRTDPLIGRERLLPGLSLIIRAKNESLNVEGCIGSVAGLAEEVIFVDNGSTDDTLAKAERLAARHPNVKVYSYPVKVPRVGRDHAEAVIARSSNTLGEYYNWCLSKATRYNFTKWDADFICLQENFREMYARHDLATRGDNICLYYSGLEVYTDGERWWADLDTMQHEYRLFSKRHGCTWVDIPPWEELDQAYLYKSRKEYYLKPVYLEVFRIDLTEFERRGVYLRDARDRKRYENLQHYRDHRTLPDNFRLVSGPADPFFESVSLTDGQRRMMHRAQRIWGSVPSVTQHADTLVWSDHSVAQVKLLVLVMTCEANRDKADKIRASWAKDLEQQGVTFHFVVGRPGLPVQIDDDVLFVPCSDNYESLPKKTLEMLRYFVASGFDYVMKIDDDVILDADWLWESGFWRHDYVGGVVAGQWGLMPDWHFGKCSDPALNTTPYWGEFTGPWYAGGAGYVLSRRYAEAAIAHPSVFEGELYEDKAVADALRAAGLLAGDLTATIPVALASEAFAEGHEEPLLLAYDIGRDEDYGAARDALRERRRPPAAPKALSHYADATPIRVTTDWCSRVDVFRSELSDEDAA